MSRSTSLVMRLHQLETRLLGNEPGNGSSGVRPQYPEPHITLSLGGSRGRNTSPG